jgi:hypothetical protein
MQYYQERRSIHFAVVGNIHFVVVGADNIRVDILVHDNRLEDPQGRNEH